MWVGWVPTGSTAPQVSSRFWSRSRLGENGGAGSRVPWGHVLRSSNQTCPFFHCFSVVISFCWRLERGDLGLEYQQWKLRSSLFWLWGGVLHPRSLPDFWTNRSIRAGIQCLCNVQYAFGRFWNSQGLQKRLREVYEQDMSDKPPRYDVWLGEVGWVETNPWRVFKPFFWVMKVASRNLTKKKLQLGRDMTMVLFQVFPGWSLVKYLFIHPDSWWSQWNLRYWKEMIGTIEIHEYLSTSFNIIHPPFPLVEKPPPFLEKTYDHLQLQAEDSTFAFTEPKAQDVESEVWWPWRGPHGTTQDGRIVGGWSNSPKFGGSFRKKKNLSSKKARQPSERKIPPT